ncbi:MAG: PRC-barrel domain-containing protein [Rhodomicrobium sp.]
MGNESEKIKNILVASATACSLILAGSTLALAQQPSTPPQGTTSPQAQPAPAQPNAAGGSEGSSLSNKQATLQRSQLVGKKLYGKDGREVGTIQNVTTTASGDVKAAEVDTGGFLGIGTKRISVPADQLQFKGDRIVDNAMTADQISKLPAMVKK